jgi:hypothetical protein
VAQHAKLAGVRVEYVCERGEHTAKLSTSVRDDRNSETQLRFQSAGLRGGQEKSSSPTAKTPFSRPPLKRDVDANAHHAMVAWARAEAALGKETSRYGYES